jgi:hypothetical protein
VLFRRGELQRIAAGEVDRAFRRWRRPTVKAGGRLRTAVGVLAITAVDRIDPDAITDDEARRAGFADAGAVRSALAGRADGDVYRIAFRLAGADPRAALRADDRLEPDAIARIVAALARADRRSVDGAWTLDMLVLVDRHPGRRAADLAAEAGTDVARFKRRVGRLKELGLTESLAVGYHLSPRGVRVLDHLRGRR